MIAVDNDWRVEWYIIMIVIEKSMDDVEIMRNAATQDKRRRQLTMFCSPFLPHVIAADRGDIGSGKIREHDVTAQRRSKQLLSHLEAP